MGQKTARDIRHNLDRKVVEQLLKKWKQENRKRFIVLSGFWIPVLEEYNAFSGFYGLHADLVHLDCAASTSWQLYDTRQSGFNHVWMANFDQGTLEYRLDVAPRILPVEFLQRDNRVIVHGGGWGIGTYRETLDELDKAGIQLDVLAYEYRDCSEARPSMRILMIDPDWMPWIREGTRHTFPPLGEVRNGRPTDYKANGSFPEVYDFIRRCKAIVSKPGAGTLIDSFSSATPLIFLNPFGSYEQKNSLLWERLGFGISFQKWRDAGFSMEIVTALHQNILQHRPHVKNFIEEYDATANLS
jgi:hypothetical protein